MLCKHHGKCAKLASFQYAAWQVQTYLQEAIHACYTTSNACVNTDTCILACSDMDQTSTEGHLVLYNALLYSSRDLIPGTHPDRVQRGSHIVLR